MSNSSESKIRQIPVEQLQLDPQNPRLPEEMDGTISTDVVKFYLDNYVLDELIDSFKESGYFEQEPMIVLDPGSDAVEAEDKTYIVLEGNRRLAALIQLLGLDGRSSDVSLDPPTEARRASLEKIPCFVASSRSAVASHLGFKHIGGLKEWSPEAKARFVVAEVRRYAENGGTGNPFAHVARMVGSQAQYVRLSFTALELLRRAKTKGIKTSYVANHRFGVWLRAMSSQGVKERIGIELPKTLEELENSIAATNTQWLRAVVKDLTPSDGQPSILVDSLDVTSYGHVLANDRAYKLLQDTRDLRVAEQRVSGVVLATKIDRVARRVVALINEAEELEEGEPGAYEAAKLLLSKARTLSRVLRPEDE